MTGRSPRSQKIEQAMVEAVKRCLEAGITDPEVIRQAQLEARDRIKAENADAM